MAEYVAEFCRVAALAVERPTPDYQMLAEMADSLKGMEDISRGLYTDDFTRLRRVLSNAMAGSAP